MEVTITDKNGNGSFAIRLIYFRFLLFCFEAEKYTPADYS